MNKYKEFIEDTGQGLRFTSWEYTKKIQKKHLQKNSINKRDIDCRAKKIEVEFKAKDNYTTKNSSKSEVQDD